MGYIILAHEEDCQMVVGNIMRIRKTEDAGVGDHWGSSNQDLSLPRQCTCESQQVDLAKEIAEAIKKARFSGFPIS